MQDLMWADLAPNCALRSIMISVCLQVAYGTLKHGRLPFSFPFNSPTRFPSRVTTHLHRLSAGGSRKPKMGSGHHRAGDGGQALQYFADMDKHAHSPASFQSGDVQLTSSVPFRTLVTVWTNLVVNRANVVALLLSAQSTQEVRSSHVC